MHLSLPSHNVTGQLYVRYLRYLRVDSISTPLFANSSFYWHDTLSVYLYHILNTLSSPHSCTWHRYIWRRWNTDLSCMQSTSRLRWMCCTWHCLYTRTATETITGAVTMPWTPTWNCFISKIGSRKRTQSSPNSLLFGSSNNFVMRSCVISLVPWSNNKGAPNTSPYWIICQICRRTSKFLLHPVFHNDVICHFTFSTTVHLTTIFYIV